MKIIEKIKELMKLHSAGATVRHSSPFDSLEIPSRDEYISDEELLKWVFPSPGAVFGLEKSDDFIRLCSEITPKITYELLAVRNWRHRVTAACYSAVHRYIQFEKEIGDLLLRSEVSYAGKGYCVALASFNSASAIDYVERYLDYYLTQKSLYFDQSDAMAALALYDEENGTSKMKSRLDLWNKFTEDKPNWNLQGSISGFREQLVSVKNIRTKLCI